MPRFEVFVVYSLLEPLNSDAWCYVLFQHEECGRA